MEILSIILLDYRKSAKECSRKLEYEENNNKLATLQGELSACRLFLDTFRNGFSSSSFYDSIGDLDDQYVPKFDKLTDGQIAELEKQRMLLGKDKGFDKFLQVFDRAIETKKEWLFNSAEKGRDLIFVHGWRDGLKKHTTIMNQIEHQYDWRLENNPLFADDLDINTDDNKNGFKGGVITLDFNETLLIESSSDVIEADSEVIE